MLSVNAASSRLEDGIFVGCCVFLDHVPRATGHQDCSETGPANSIASPIISADAMVELAAGLGYIGQYVHSFIYVFCQVDGASNLQSRSNIVYQLYSTLSAAASMSSDRTLDVAAFFLPAALEGSNDFPMECVRLMQDTLRLNDPKAARFYQRTLSTGPVGLWRPWGPAKRNDTDADCLLGGCSHRSMPDLLVPVNVGASNLVARPPPFDFSIHGQFDTTVLGGTFDYLHCGHKYLLTQMTLLASSRMVIAISDDQTNLIDRKLHRQLIQPFCQREAQVIQFLKAALGWQGRQALLSNSDGSLTPLVGRGLGEPVSAEEACNKDILVVEICRLRDSVGPAGYRPDFSALIVTSETRRGGNAVNAARSSNGLPAMHIVELPVLNSGNSGGRLCSTDIRRNMADASHCEEVKGYCDQAMRLIGISPVTLEMWKADILGILRSQSFSHQRQVVLEFLKATWERCEADSPAIGWLTLCSMMAGICVSQDPLLTREKTAGIVSLLAGAEGPATTEHYCFRSVAPTTFNGGVTPVLARGQLQTHMLDILGKRAYLLSRYFAFQIELGSSFTTDTFRTEFFSAMQHFQTSADAFTENVPTYPQREPGPRP